MINKISILFIDINQNGFYGISRFLSTLPEFDCIPRNELPPDEAEHFIRFFGPEVIILDTGLPVDDNFNYISKLNKTFKNSKILLFTDSTDKSIIEKAVEHGVSGYVLRNSNVYNLINAIKTVADGRFYYKLIKEEVKANEFIDLYKSAPIISN